MLTSIQTVDQDNLVVLQSYGEQLKVAQIFPDQTLLLAWFTILCFKIVFLVETKMTSSLLLSLPCIVYTITLFFMYIVDFYCSHERGIYYFAESIGSPFAFPSCKCEDWKRFTRDLCECGNDISFMGEHSPKTYVRPFYCHYVHTSAVHYQNSLLQVIQDMLD